MRFYLYILALLIISSCSDKPDFDRLEFSFNRSWAPSAYYNFDRDKNELETYQTAYWDSYDTINYKIFNLSETNVDLFYEEIHAIKYDSSLSVAGHMWLDGKSFSLLKISENHSDTIACLNPHRDMEYNGNGEFDKEYRILSALTDFIYENIQDSAVCLNTKMVYSAFDGEFNFKKISNEPLHYSVWGRQNFKANDNDSLKFIEFVRELPVDQKVIIELSSLNVEDFYKIDTKKSQNIYFYGSNYVKWLKHEYTWIEEEEEELRYTPEWLINSLDSICTTSELCIYNDSNTYKHDFYHKYENRLLEIKKITPNYYLNRSEALNALK